MKRKIITAIIAALWGMTAWAIEVNDTTTATTPTAATGAGGTVLSEFSSSRALAAAKPDDRVIIGADTVGMIIPQRNFGRYDRGLFNFLFIPKGQWAFGLTASYGELNTDDVQILSLIKDIDFKGKIYSINPTISYFIRNNQSLGLRFTFSNGDAKLASLGMNFDEDLNFNIRDVSYSTQSYGVSFFYRNYIGLSTMKRFGIFNEVELGVQSGSSRFMRIYDDRPRDTRTTTTAAQLNFSPGVCMFIMDYISFNVSFGVFGLHLTHESQLTDGRDEGSRTTSGANFRFNLFNIKFGIGVHI